jgi:hypothetical protein
MLPRGSQRRLRVAAGRDVAALLARVKADVPSPFFEVIAAVPLKRPRCKG